MNWNTAQLNELLDSMIPPLRALLEKQQAPVHLIGIHAGGVWVARALAERLQPSPPLGTLDPSFYRDDFEQRGMKPNPQRSQLPASLDDCCIILVDDVLMSGRTVRAAINELFDYGRPAAVYLAVLFDVGRRELPIQPDICARHLPLGPSERVELLGPAPLSARVIDTGMHRS